MAFEDDLGWEYFGTDIHSSPRMMEHMEWHDAVENKERTGNYGERFLLFHKAFGEKFDDFRRSKQLLPVTGWDPATKIPDAFDHPHFIHDRASDNPSAVAPGCKTPTWCSVEGGTDIDPLFGYQKLLQFKSLDELGRAIDKEWHPLVHNTIGGDMGTTHSPIDPIFWRWHKWVDMIRARWAAGQVRLGRQNVAFLSQILFSSAIDTPDTENDLKSIAERVSSNPGDVYKMISHQIPEARNLLAGQLVHHLSTIVDGPEISTKLQEIAAQLRGKD